MNRYASIDSLESRCLLNAALNSGILTVNGSNSADVITLQLSGGNIAVTINPEGFAQSFSTSGLTRIDVVCDAGNDSFTADAGITVPINIDGGAGTDSIVTAAGDDTLAGGSEDDTLDGGLGADSIVGDTGTDTLSYVARTGALNVTLDGVANDGESGENDFVDTTIDILYGGSGNDMFDATGSPADFRGWYGNGGDDTLIGGSTGDRLNGGKGNDSLVGGDGDETLIGGGGDDTFAGGNGQDIVTYYASTRRLRIDLAGTGANGEFDTNEHDSFATADTEILVGGSGNDTLKGTTGDDAMYGGPGADLLQGFAGNDYLAGNDGDDFLQGDDGNDTFRGGSGHDTMSGGGGIDLATHSERSKGIKANLTNPALSEDRYLSAVENLDGTPFNDTLTSGLNSGNNIIRGLNGDDTINSQDGDIDTVDGGNGTDAITSDSNDVVTP